MENDMSIMILFFTVEPVSVCQSFGQESSCRGSVLER